MNVFEARMLLVASGLVANVSSKLDFIHGGHPTEDVLAGLQLVHYPFRIFLKKDGSATVSPCSQVIFELPFDSLSAAVQFVAEHRHYGEKLRDYLEKENQTRES